MFSIEMHSRWWRARFKAPFCVFTRLLRSFSQSKFRSFNESVPLIYYSCHSMIVFLLRLCLLLNLFSFIFIFRVAPSLSCSLLGLLLLVGCISFYMPIFHSISILIWLNLQYVLKSLPFALIAPVRKHRRQAKSKANEKHTLENNSQHR